MTTVIKWTGRVVVVASLGLWLVWFAWRVTSPMVGPVGVVVLVLELAALAVAVVVSAALWSAPRREGVRTRPAADPALFPGAFALSLIHI